MRRLLEHDPGQGDVVLGQGDWLVDYLWPVWGSTLRAVDESRDFLLSLTRSYAYEIRLWVVGERPWDQFISGLCGRVVRRVNGIQ